MSWNPGFGRLSEMMSYAHNVLLGEVARYMKTSVSPEHHNILANVQQMFPRLPFRRHSQSFSQVSISGCM